MTDRPILFSGAMVRALLDGVKTQTRRLIVPQPGTELGSLPAGAWDAGFVDVKCPYGRPGDRLWVRETFSYASGNGKRLVYRADLDTDRWPPTVETRGAKWKPSIFMRRVESRLTLAVEAVRVERLQDISEPDARAEGIPWKLSDALAIGRGGTDTARSRYATLWDSINAKRATWASDPWVWVVTFSRVQP